MQHLYEEIGLCRANKEGRQFQTIASIENCISWVCCTVDRLVAFRYRVSRCDNDDIGVNRAWPRAPIRQCHPERQNSCEHARGLADQYI